MTTSGQNVLKYSLTFWLTLFVAMGQFKAGNCADISNQLAEITNKLDDVLGNLSRLEVLINATQPIDPYFKCDKGAPSDVARKKFLLWGRVPALCDTETDGGGWVIIQRRTKNDTDFYRGWDAYKKGFGNPETDYWLGNDNIYNLTSHGYNILRVDLERQGVKRFIQYSGFNVASELDNYQLVVGKAYGDAGNLLNKDNGMYFSTHDRDNDNAKNINCALYLHGSWWYNSCSESNLNGQWKKPATNMSMHWAPTDISLESSELKVRFVDIPVEN